jgi:hypothetical protein
MSSAIASGSVNCFGIRRWLARLRRPGIGRSGFSYSAFARRNRPRPAIYATAKLG